MPDVNLVKDYGWAKMFHKTGDKPTLPAQLTSKWWSKQKQLIASGKETGIGAALDELQKLYKPVVFPTVMGREDLRESDTKKCQEAMKSPALKSFVKQLKEITKLAKEHVGTFKGATQKTGDALKEIGEVAAAVVEVCDEDYLQKCLDTALDEAVDKKFEVLVANAGLMIEARDGVLKKIPAGLENIKQLVTRYAMDRKPASAQLVGGALTSYCRDMTQVIFNMLKLDNGGYELEGFNSVKAAAANDKLVRWADSKTVISYETPEAAAKDVKAVGEATKDWILVVKGVKLPKKK